MDEKERTLIGQYEARDIFDKSIKGTEGQTMDEQKLNHQLEIKAFMIAFGKLDGYEDDGFKKYRAGGRMTNSDQMLDENWQDQAHDYLSLMRNIIIQKLNINCGIETMMVLS
mmetsp:Transcript_19231/g.3110  ORF Transcript_19231/g.3110 Transcript_19231/m.3110 type:complete len:112 (-) Transcript_19231:332-667(-)